MHVSLNSKKSTLKLIEKLSNESMEKERKINNYRSIKNMADILNLYAFN